MHRDPQLVLSNSSQCYLYSVLRAPETETVDIASTVFFVLFVLTVPWWDRIVGAVCDRPRANAVRPYGATARLDRICRGGNLPPVTITVVEKLNQNSTARLL